VDLQDRGKNTCGEKGKGVDASLNEHDSTGDERRGERIFNTKRETKDLCERSSSTSTDRPDIEATKEEWRKKKEEEFDSGKRGKPNALGQSVLNHLRRGLNGKYRRVVAGN